MSWFYGEKSRPFWNWINNIDNDFVYKLGVKLQNLEWRIRHSNLGWYILRWQASTPVFFTVLLLLGGRGLFEVIIANLIGALIFYKVDELIFKRD